MFDLAQAMHIVFGESAAGSLRAALHLSRDQVLVNDDMLSCGPAPATTDLGAWRAAREGYLKEICRESADFSFDAFAADGLLMNAERLRQERAIAVWAGVGLPDQLLLAWVVFLFDRLDLDPSKLAIVQFEKLGSTWDVFSLGELSPKEIRDPPAGAASGGFKGSGRAETSVECVHKRRPCRPCGLCGREQSSAHRSPGR